MGFLLYGLKNQIKLTNGWKQIMPYSRIRKKLEEEQGKRTPLTTNIMIVLMVAFGLTGLGHFSWYNCSFFKENYPALEKYSFTNEFFWLVITTTAGVLLSFTKVRKIESYASKRHRILIHFSGNHRNTYESGCHTWQPLIF
jgi:hypothetical protein